MSNRRDTIGITLLITALILIALIIAAGCKDGASESGCAQIREESKPRLETLTIPAGTQVVASLETRLSSETNHAGDPFAATTTARIVIDGKTVAPAGTKIHGTLRDVQASGRVKGRARMTLAYDEIVDSAGNAHTISAQPLTLQAASETHSDVEKIAAGGSSARSSAGSPVAGRVPRSVRALARCSC